MKNQNTMEYLMINKLNAEKELKGKIVELLNSIETNELKAEEIIKLSFDFYVNGSADDECFYCNKLKDEMGRCDCPQSW